MRPISDTSAAKILLWTVVASYLSIPPILFLSDMGLDLYSIRHVLTIIAGATPFMIYVRWRKMAVLPAAVEGFTAVFALLVPIMVWTYAATRVNMPVADMQLLAMDAAIGFDWLGFVAFVDSHSMLARLLALAYSSLSFQLLLLPLLFARVGNSVRSYAFIFAYVLTCAVSSVLSIWFPALGAFPVHGVAQADLTSIDVTFGYLFLEQFHAVREQADFVLNIESSVGIVTFPSVHAGAAVLCSWAAWQSRLLRLPLLVLNLLMAVSALSHGSHYLIDVVAGVGVAGLCISVTVCAFHRVTEGRSMILEVSRRFAIPARRRNQSPAAAT